MHKRYITPEGVYHIVEVMAETDPPEYGIPLSLPIEQLYAHMPTSFQAQLSAALFAVGLETIDDYLKPDAAQKARAALLGVVKNDAHGLITVAWEIKYGRQ